MELPCTLKSSLTEYESPIFYSIIALWSLFSCTRLTTELVINRYTLAFKTIPLEHAVMEIVTPSDYQNPGSRKKPRRGGRPCDRCRQRKTRCIVKERDEHGNVIACLHCSLGGSTCTFREGPAGRRHSQTDESAQSQVDGDPSRRTPSQPREQTDNNAVVFHATPRATHLGTQRIGTPLSRSQSQQDAGVEVPAPFLSTLTPESHNLSEFPELGLAPGRFAELYGLGSDMEPILMV